MAYTFKGGTRPDDHKYTAKSPISRIKDPDTVSIALSQHIGVMCKPTVSVGDTVMVGQMIGDIAGGLGCPVHSSVSGKVIRIEEVTTATGGASFNVVIENDHQNSLAPTVRPFGKKLSEATFDEILAVIRNAGITGLGGTSFPTYAKVAAAKGRVDTLIVNCCEGEPFQTSTCRLVLENFPAVLGGTKILMRALGLRGALVAIERTRRLEIKVIKENIDNNDLISLHKVSSKYPSGSEKHLVYSLTGQEIPEGKTPIDLGCIVFNAETCVAIFDAFSKGIPMIRKVVTVDGDCISEPQNLLVPIGTAASFVIEQCGGLSGNVKKLIFGGPMMGQAQWDVEAPITKGTSSILCFSDYFDKESKLEPVCIRCGRCVDACPMKLLPLDIAAYVSCGNIDKAQMLGASSCIECGICTHVCPGGLPVTQLVSRAKTEIIMKRRSSVSDK
ncbi:MAG: electron transport complex subunit RsxC [Clostridia bacterium]|nr:electron transport complex subunit RsxC [Clostridia bacterium]